MNQVKIGKFIAEMRKEKALTQRELSEKLGISEKTVSKWETGRGLPEVSLMLPLCSALGIDINELLSGERLDGDAYKDKAEDNIALLLANNLPPRVKYTVSTVAAILILLGVFAIIMLAGFLEISVAARIGMIVLALVLLFADIALLLIIALTNEAFECIYCGKKFVPTPFKYIMAPHTITRRRLKCPYCHKRAWQRCRIPRIK